MHRNWFIGNMMLGTPVGEGKHGRSKEGDKIYIANLATPIGNQGVMLLGKVGIP